MSVAIFLVSLAIGLAYLLVLAPRLIGPVGTALDGYQEIALQLVAGHGYSVDPALGPTAGRAPLYPLLLAGTYSLFGTGPTPVMIVHAVLSALTCVLVFLIGCQVFDRATGLLAGILFGVYPPRLWWASMTMSETLLALLVTATGLTLISLFQRPSARRASLAGVCLGLTALCNSVVLFLPWLLVVISAASRGLRRTHLRYLLAALGVMWLVILPWTLRNQRVFHRWIPVNSGIGWALAKGVLMPDMHQRRPEQPRWVIDQASSDSVVAALRARGLRDANAERALAVARRTSVLRPSEDESLKALAWEWAKADPPRQARKFVLNLGLFWYLSRHPLALKLMNFPLLALASLALVLGAWRRPGAGVLLLVALYYYSIYCMILAEARYSLQVAPFLTVLAAMAIMSVARRVGSHEERLSDARSSTGGPASG